MREITIEQRSEPGRHRSREEIVMQAERVRRVVLLSLVLSLSVAVSGWAEERKACSAWLTAADVESALGIEVETAEPVEYSAGFTVCSWTKDRPEGQLGVNLSFFEPQAIREGMISAESIPEYFDLQVSSRRDQFHAEPQELVGVGKRAVVFTEEHLWIVMIELEEGFVHLALSPGDITREQVEKVAKAVRLHAAE
jgi:hypothetical protein